MSPDCFNCVELYFHMVSIILVLGIALFQFCFPVTYAARLWLMVTVCGPVTYELVVIRSWLDLRFIVMRSVPASMVTVGVLFR